MHYIGKLYDILQVPQVLDRKLAFAGAIFLHSIPFFVQSVQNRNGRIETSDEIVLRMLHENWFYDTIQIVPGTLPKPIPKTDFPKI